MTPSGGTPTHGHTVGGTSPTYRSWLAMRSRCKYPSQVAYQSYGGRGITVCERWDTFANFLEDMGERPEGATIDRIDVNGNYEPTNCRWATASEQQTNKRPGWHRNGRKTHCPQGHPYDEANTYVTSTGHRLCRACHRANQNRYRGTEDLLPVDFHGGGFVGTKLFVVPRGVPVHSTQNGKWAPAGRKRVIELDKPGRSVWRHGEWVTVTWPGQGGYWRRVVLRDGEFVARSPASEVDAAFARADVVPMRPKAVGE